MTLRKRNRFHIQSGKTLVNPFGNITWFRGLRRSFLLEKLGKIEHFMKHRLRKSLNCFVNFFSSIHQSPCFQP